MRRPPARRLPRSQRYGELLVAALLVLAAVVVLPAAKDSFRLPKLMLSGWLGLASLLPLTWRLREAGTLGLRRLVSSPVVQAVVPLLAAATLGLATTAHPAHVRQALADLWIGAACLVGWSLALPAARLRRLLDLLQLPATLLAAVAVLQFHGLWKPLLFVGGEETRRMGITSLAGNPGDLGAYLVLPCLLAQAALWERRRRAWLWGAALALDLYALVLCQSLTALAGLLAGSLVLWWKLLPRRRFVVVVVVAAAGLAVATAGVPPLRQRVAAKARSLEQGHVNLFLTGRLDGWRAAAWMFRQHPLVGVGHGAYQAVFTEAKLTLLDEGVRFLAAQQNPTFANAHNEYLEVAADCGVVGLAALVWGLVVLVRRLRRIDGRRGPPGGERGGADAALAWAGVVAAAVLALTFFPLRTAVVAYPLLLMLAWVFASAAGEEPA